jgi:hypothetical protein
VECSSVFYYFYFEYYQFYFNAAATAVALVHGRTATSAVHDKQYHTLIGILDAKSVLFVADFILHATSTATTASYLFITNASAASTTTTTSAAILPTASAAAATTITTQLQ